METIINIPECTLPSEVGSLPGDLARPPPAKFENIDVPTFVDVVKPKPVTSGGNQTLLKWGLLSVLLLGVTGWGCVLADKLLESEPVVISEARPALEDPLDDFLHMFMGQGVEPSDNGCVPCFFGDEGRVRKAAGAEDAFMVYKSTDSANAFQVITHIFNPPSNLAFGTGPAPFTFWTAADQDADGEPDAWLPATAEYRKEGSVMGWERGIFFGGLPAHPFLKIELHDMQGAWRPQVGSVQLMISEDGNQDDVQPEDNDAMGGIVGLEALMTDFLQNELVHLAEDLAQMQPTSDDAAHVHDGLTTDVEEEQVGVDDVAQDTTSELQEDVQMPEALDVNGEDATQEMEVVGPTESNVDHRPMLGINEAVVLKSQE